jgi:CheY-like chemotaxis protein
MSEMQRILIVDDEAGVRRTFARILKAENYATTEVASGEEALIHLQNQPCDLVLLDLKMPGLSGVETLRRIRDNHKVLPVYIITAFRTEFFSDLQKLASQGVSFELMKKPIESQQLIEVVNSVLSHSQTD